MWETVEVTFRSVLKTVLKSFTLLLNKRVTNSTHTGMSQRWCRQICLPLGWCSIFTLLLERSVLNLRARLQSLRFNKGIWLALTGVNSDPGSAYAFLAKGLVLKAMLSKLVQVSSET